MIVCEAGMLLGGKQIILLSFVISKTYFTATLTITNEKTKKQKRNNNLTNTNEPLMKITTRNLIISLIKG